MHIYIYIHTHIHTHLPLSYFQDYPSTDFVRNLLNEQQISVIFAIDPNLEVLYNKLEAFWRTAVIAIQGPEASDLINSIRERYEVREDLISICKGQSYISNFSVSGQKCVLLSLNVLQGCLVWSQLL